MNMTFQTDKLQWTREPKAYTVTADRVEIVTQPHTDLWQRTYYHFRNMWQGGGVIRFGIYAYSPEASSFKAVFTHMEVTDCKWFPHDGQPPDEE